jgi:hypothetical protein
MNAAIESLREQREAVVRRHMESENSHDYESVFGTFAHPRYEIMTTGVVYDGLEQVQQYFRDTRAAFPDQSNELISLRHADDAVIVEFWLMGTHLGTVPTVGLRPTGNAFRCRMTAFFIFDEGAGIVCERVYFDGLTMLKQLLTGVSLRKPASLRVVFDLLRGMKNTKT